LAIAQEVSALPLSLLSEPCTLRYGFGFTNTKIRLLTAAILGFTTMVSAFGSSIFSAATRIVGAEYGVSSEVGLLGVSLYVLGFAFGPTLWAPLSELRGKHNEALFYC
jgi:MFS family permease